MVWGCMGSAGVGNMEFIDGVMDHKMYIEIIKRNLKHEKDESIRANLKQYGCADRYVDVVVADFSNRLWHPRISFDSIITDRKSTFYRTLKCV